MARTGWLWGWVALASGALVACGSTTDDAGLGTAGGGGKIAGGAGGTAGAAGAGAGGSFGGAAGFAGSATGGGGSGGGVAGVGGATGGSAGTGAGGATGGVAGASGGTSGGGTGGTGITGPHTVGGVVSGLYGSNLKLQNNGGDEIPIAKDGPFTFPTKVSTGSPYSVTVSSPPTNPAQSCTVSKGSGTVGTSDVSDVVVSCALVDTDGDNVPDVADPFPNDPTKPKLATPNRVYPHTASKLFTMDVKTYAVTEIGSFQGSGYFGSMTDLAVDQWGVIYGVTFGDLWTCDGNTATCYHLATLPQSFNGLTMLPPGTHHPFLDTLVGIAISGAWYKITLSGSGAATLSQLGSYGSGYTSSGDAFSIAGVGTYASVDKSGSSYDVIVAVDPMTGAVKSEVGVLTGYSSVYGLAGYQGEVYGFDETGKVLKIDTKTGASSVIATTNNPWWGAGVSTRLATN